MEKTDVEIEEIIYAALESVAPNFKIENNFDLDCLDSFQLIELMMLIEENHKIVVQPDEFNSNNFGSIKNLTEYIRKK